MHSHSVSKPPLSVCASVPVRVCVRVAVRGLMQQCFQVAPEMFFLFQCQDTACLLLQPHSLSFQIFPLLCRPRFSQVVLRGSWGIRYEQVLNYLKWKSWERIKERLYEKRMWFGSLNSKKDERYIRNACRHYVPGLVKGRDTDKVNGKKKKSNRWKIIRKGGLRDERGVCKRSKRIRVVEELKCWL